MGGKERGLTEEDGQKWKPFLWEGFTEKKTPALFFLNVQSSHMMMWTLTEGFSPRKVRYGFSENAK